MVVLPDNNDNKNDSSAFVAPVALAVAKAYQLYNQHITSLSLDGEDKQMSKDDQKQTSIVWTWSFATPATAAELSTTWLILRWSKFL